MYTSDIIITPAVLYGWFCNIIGIVWGITKHNKYYPPPSASGNISQTSGKQFPIVTSTPVTICIVCTAFNRQRLRLNSEHKTLNKPDRLDFHYKYIRTLNCCTQGFVTFSGLFVIIVFFKFLVPFFVNLVNFVIFLCYFLFWLTG